MLRGFFLVQVAQDIVHEECFPKGKDLLSENLAKVNHVSLRLLW